MNDSRSPDPRRELADELAELLRDERGTRTVRLLQMLGFLTGEMPPSSSTAPAVEGPRAISIWRPRQDGDELIFERPEPLPLGDHYATRRVFRARKEPGTKRVVFCGESVAAGYLYAPHLTPAEVLAEQLEALAGPQAFEVIDLARTNETLAPLVETVESALQLAPDHLVIFVGNNWNLLETPDVSPHAPSTRARQRYALALRRKGVAGAVDWARRELRAKAEDALRRLAELATSHEIDVVLVVPEVNLADWSSRQPVTWLPGDATARWHELYSEAEVRLAKRNFKAAVSLAEQMLELDGGACPTSHRVLALAELGLGRQDAARRACQAEVDSHAYATLAFLGAPQATTAVQEILRRAVDRYGWALVDLPRIFADHTASPLPGRRLFLDYCHLTVEGMHVAMGAVCAALFELLGSSFQEIFPSDIPPGDEESDTDRDKMAVEIAGRSSNDLDPGPQRGPSVKPGAGQATRSVAGEPQVTGPNCPRSEGAESAGRDRQDACADAVAKLGAAVHTAHRLVAVGEKREILEYWCHEALKASPGIEQTMLELATARCAPLPEVLNAVQEANLASPYRLLLQHGWRWDGLDPELLLTFRTVLAATGRQGSADRIDRLILEHHALGEDPVELMRPTYLWDPLERAFPEAMTSPELVEGAIFRALWPRSSFCLIHTGGTDIELAITARLPKIADAPARRDRRLRVEVDGVTVAEGELSVAWRRIDLRLSASDLRSGLQRLSLCWPPLPPAGEAAMAAAVRRLEEGRSADIHPVFGEIFSLRARLCDRDG